MKLNFSQKDKAPSQYFEKQVNFIAQISKAQEIKNGLRRDQRPNGIPPQHPNRSYADLNNASSSAGWLLPDGSTSRIQDSQPTMGRNPLQTQQSTHRAPSPYRSLGGATPPL